jgi:hypothetical protein
MSGHIDSSDIIVVLEHPFGTVETPLEKWMEDGPGPRLFVRPYAVKRSDGTRLSMRVIPLRYRNNLFSRTLIELGVLSNPWKSKIQGSE